MNPWHEEIILVTILAGLAVALFLSGAARAELVTVSAVAPTERTDGSTFDASEIGGYQVHYDCGAGVEILVFPDQVQTFEREFDIDTNGQDYCDFQLAIYDTQDNLSALTAAVQNTDPFNRPSALVPTVNFITPVNANESIETQCEILTRCEVIQ